MEESSLKENEINKDLEYSARAASSIINGEVKLKVGNTALGINALFETIELPFAEINAINLNDYIVTIKTDDGDYAFSRLGSWCEPFYDMLCDTYNKAVLRSLFIKGGPLVTARGSVTIDEPETNLTVPAPVHVYENNVTSLPYDLTARRVPLCFAESVEKGNYEYTIRLDTGESYTYAKLGYDTDPFAGAVESRIIKLREQTLAAVKQIDPALTAAEASRIARLIPLGSAAPVAVLAGTAPSFVTALENKLSATRAAESYAVFKDLSGAAGIWLGIRKNENLPSDPNETPDDPPPSPDPDGAEETGAPDAAETGTDEYLLWLIASSPDGARAAVEFAEPDSATFIYNTGGDFARFAKQLSRALEAINFKREVIRLSDEELRKLEYSDYYMAAKRTPALQTIRSSFVTRIIHSTPESWKKRLIEGWGRRY